MNRLTKTRHQQKGLSSVGWIAVVGIFLVLGTGFFKVFPMYYENFKVNSVMDALQQDTSVDSKSKRAIWESLSKRLFIEEVRSITKEHVSITRKDGKTTVTLTYETRDNFIGNLFIGARFVETRVIDR